jgi:cell division inhibitor SepF
MPGAMRKLGLYLGLVEDDEDARDARDRRYADDAYEGEDHDLDDDAPVASRRWTPGDDGTARTTTLRRPATDPLRTRTAVALDTATPRPAVATADAYRITTLHPRTYNEARAIGEHFRQGTPVIMNLTEMDDVDAKRLVDFAAGLIFGLRGSIERVTNKVFLLSPEHVEVTAEDKARIAEGGFFNQS